MQKGVSLSRNALVVGFEGKAKGKPTVLRGPHEPTILLDVLPSHASSSAKISLAGRLAWCGWLCKRLHWTLLIQETAWVRAYCRLHLVFSFVGIDFIIF